MYDVDDDNDGIPDTCIQTDTNGDGQGDYPIENAPIGIPGIDCEMDYDRAVSYTHLPLPTSDQV